MHVTTDDTFKVAINLNLIESFLLLFKYDLYKFHVPISTVWIINLFLN